MAPRAGKTTGNTLTRDSETKSPGTLPDFQRRYP